MYIKVIRQVLASLSCQLIVFNVQVKNVKCHQNISVFVIERSCSRVSKFKYSM